MELKPLVACPADRRQLSIERYTPSTHGMTAEPFWTIQCDGAELARLAKEPAFAAITNLARCVNALRFAATAFPPRESDSPSDRRQRLNAMMCSLGFLHESLEASRRLGKHFRHLPAFTRLQRIRKTSEYKGVESALRQLRNTSVFHFDEEQAGRALTSFRQQPGVFASGVGDRAGDSYYELADIAAMQAFIGPTKSSVEWLSRQRELAKSASKLSSLFVPAADDLIAEALASFGFTMVEGSSHPHDEHEQPGR